MHAQLAILHDASQDVADILMKNLQPTTCMIIVTYILTVYFRS